MQTARDQDLKSFFRAVISASDKFINKVETGFARSKETYQDLIKLRAEAIRLYGAFYGTKTNN